MLSMALVTIAVLTTSPFAATAQTVPVPAAREISGRVLDAAGLAVPGATVALSNISTGLERLETTDATGAYRFSDLDVLDGSGYRVSVTIDGFAPAARDGRPGSRVDIELRPAQVVESVTVVSGSRQAELRESLSTPVNVVVKSRLQDTTRSSVGEVLREVPGVLTRRGSEATTVAGEQVQGIDSRQVLVLVDGQPIAGARGIKSGAINLDRQSTYRLERVEIVKGAASALFGSDAIGGVINMITRDSASPLEAMATVSGGEHGTFDAAATAGGRRGRMSLFGTVSRAERESFDLTPTTPDTTGGQFTRHDGFGRIGFRPTSALIFTATGSGYWNTQTGRVTGEAGLLDSQVDDDSQAVAGSALWQAGPRTSVESRLYWTRFAETNAGTLVSSQAVQPTDELFESVSKADASVSHVLGERHLLQGGAELLGNRYRGVNRVRDDDGHDATTSAAWGQDRISVASWLTLTLGGRYDYHSTFGSAFSPKLAVNARVVEGLHARASYGEGYRAPDLGQLYYRFVPSANFYQVIGNPDLEPEYAESWQAGADYSHRSGRLRIGLNAFRNNVNDLIEAYSLGFIATPAQLAAVLALENIDPSFRPQFGRQLFVYRNVANARTEGVELDGEAVLGGSFQLAGAYTYLDARDLTRNQPLAGRHRHQGSTRLTWFRESLGLRAEIRGSFYSSWIAVASRGGADPGVRAPGFALWDTYVFKKIASGVEVFGALDNLTDNQDPNTGQLLPAGTPAPIYRAEIGRTIRFGVRWQFDRK
jgi:outer membrane receptor for ferrienterochelin and colicins